jgi:excisionase family DNA binding protein
MINNNPFEVLEDRLINLETLLLDVLQEHKKVIVKDEPQKFIAIDEAATVLHKSKPTVYRLASERRIPSFKNGKSLLFKESDLLAFIEQTRRKSSLEIKAEATNQKKGLNNGK